MPSICFVLPIGDECLFCLFSFCDMYTHSKPKFLSLVHSLKIPILPLSCCLWKYSFSYVPFKPALGFILSPSLNESLGHLYIFSVVECSNVVHSSQNDMESLFNFELELGIWLALPNITLANMTQAEPRKALVQQTLLLAALGALSCHVNKPGLFCWIRKDHVEWSPSHPSFIR